MRAARVIGVLTASLVLAGVLGLLATAFLPAWPVHHVVVPPDDASPEQVVAAYLEALDGHDCNTAKALWVTDDQETPALWCDDVRALDDVHLGAYDDRTGVQVAFDLDWRLFHDDGSMPEGPTTWGYDLEQEGPDGAWRISGNGMG